MNKYKALMIDLDGTTVPHFTDNLSERVIKRVREAHQYVKVCIVTGRPLDETLYLIETLQITGPCVLLNGGQIYDPIQKEIVNELHLVQEHVADIYNTLLPFSPSFFVYDGKKALPADQWTSLPHVVDFYLPDISPEAVQQIAKAMEAFPDTTTNRMLGTRSGVESIEVSHANATKQYGIYEVAKILQINTHEIIGVGDSYNDFPLLMASGLKIAMGNAVPELKAIADFVAPPVDEDGVAVVIEKFILP